jgi:UDP-N-acetylmuramoyl-L-alanyl-D-glutamate--2,6-diaminopimelate ligase
VSARLSSLAARLSEARIEARLALRANPDDVELVDATHDSREVRSGALFCAVRGQVQDGHEHAAAAVEAGAAVLLVERVLDLDVPQVVVPSVRQAMGHAAALIHDDPSRELRMLGVTGTNGKTTVTFLLEAAMAAAGWGSGRIGTLGARLHGRGEPGQRTTPEATDLQRLLRSMRTRGADGVAMEVSSHGLDLQRVDGVVFDVVAFTNLTQDHLDWHGTMERYLAAKARLFTPELARHGVVLLDAPGARDLLDLAAIPLTTVGVAEDAEVRVHDRAVGPEGSRAVLDLDGTAVELRTVMRGTHNLDNLIVAAVTAVRAGLDPAMVAAALAEVPAPPGRLEPFGGGEQPLVLVDYAHTPDAVAGAVVVGRGLVAQGGRLHVVIGAGGDRDREKRTLMGAAVAGADLVVVTDDNPRSEDPAAIRAAVLLGTQDGRAEAREVPGRAAAVRVAVADAAPGDVVLVLGRGHETHQEIAGEQRPLDDRALVRDALVALAAHERAPEGGRP